MNNKNYRFKSKNHALQSAVKVWACKSCVTWHTPKKPEICTQCGFNEFYYFASKFEAKRFGELDLQRKIGHITELQTQVTYPIKVNGMDICKYIADFQYKDLAGNLIVEDTKGSKEAVTELFKLKRKLIGAVYGIDIKPIYQSARKRK
jgi:hypothetical protein